MVNDKARSRATGPMVNLTRQPMEGRSRADKLGTLLYDLFREMSGASIRYLLPNC